MYTSGAKGLMDAVGSHPYGGPWPFDRPNGTDDAGTAGLIFARSRRSEPLWKSMATPIPKFLGHRV